MKKTLDAIFNMGLPARDIKNANYVNLWIFIWVVSMLGSIGLIEIGREAQWSYFSALALSTIALHTLIGVIMVFVYKRFLSALDEMERSVQLNALAATVGVVFVGFSSYSILEKAAFLPYLKFEYILMAMSLTYSLGLIIGRVRLQ